MDKKCQKILVEGKAGVEIKTTTEIRTTIKELENKKAGNMNNCKLQWIKEEGNKMMQSLTTLFNRKK